MIGIWIIQHAQTKAERIETERFASVASSAKQIRKKNKGHVEEQGRGNQGPQKESGRSRDVGGEFDRNEIRSTRSRPTGELRSQLNSPEILRIFNSLELRRRISDL